MNQKTSKILRKVARNSSTLNTAQQQLNTLIRNLKQQYNKTPRNKRFALKVALTSQYE